MPYSYIEGLGDQSPSSASFTARAQTAGGAYYTDPVLAGDLPARILDVLGYTGTAVAAGANAGKITRFLPLRHPQYQWLFADSFRPRGVGKDFQTVNAVAPPGGPILPQFPLYAKYVCDISFGQRDYNVWQDKDVRLINGTYYPKDDTGSGGGTAFTFATEWMRFCTFELTPLNNFISAQQGQMRFRAGDPPGSGSPEPDNVQYQDSPKMYLPDCALKVRWYQVPYRYLTSSNSYLRKFIGHINQNSWGDQPQGANSFGPYPAGSLLYHGARPVAIYSNVLPDPGLLAYNAGGNGFSRARLCDLELDFTYTARTAGYDIGDTPDFSTVNRNWIVAGHNLLPWLKTRKFYYTSTYDVSDPTTQSKWYPTFNSFAFELLFTDPDAQPGSPLLDP